MKAAIWLSFLALSATAALAQRGGGGPAPSRGGGFAPGAIGPGGRSGRPFGPRSSGYYPALPPYYDGYDYGYAPAPEFPPQPPASPPVVVVQPPPAPIHSEIREYVQEAANVPPVTEEPALFALVLRDGTVRSAAAVFFQNDGVHYVDPDGRHGVVAFDAIDREATRRLNQERKLRLQIPYPAN